MHELIKAYNEVIIYFKCKL